MVIYSYSLPAILALASKLVILTLSRRSKVKNSQTRLFEMAIVLSIGLNLAEISAIQRLFESTPRYEGTIYFATSIALISVLAHLALQVSHDNPYSKSALPVYFILYGYALSLECLVVFTKEVIAGMEDFRGYSMTRVPGPLHWMFEVFVVGGFLIVLLAPLSALFRKTSSRVRNQCKLWFVAAAPLGLLVITIIVMLHFNIRWFNSTVTTPLLITLFLAIVGYVVHKPHVIEVDYYLPWSRMRKRKCELYSKLSALNRDIPTFGSLEEVIKRLAETLGCPIYFLGSLAMQVRLSGGEGSLSDFPTSRLTEIRRLMTVDEARYVAPHLYDVMWSHGVAAVVAFYPGSKSAAGWLLLGRPFNEMVFSQRDLKVIRETFRTMASAFLDGMLKAGHVAPERSRISGTAFFEDRHNRPLPELVQEFEAQIIEATMESCAGNQAEAARELGLRPNTLHYKIRRYGLQRAPGVNGALEKWRAR